MGKYLQTTIPEGGSAGPDLGDGWTYRSELTRCAKAGCRRCGGRTYAHGPYWYAYRHEGGRLLKVYIGVELRRVSEKTAGARPGKLLPKKQLAPKPPARKPLPKTVPARGTDADVHAFVAMVRRIEASGPVRGAAVPVQRVAKALGYTDSDAFRSVQRVAQRADLVELLPWVKTRGTLPSGAERWCLRDSEGRPLAFARAVATA
jgi:hypothetical protein